MAWFLREDYNGQKNKIIVGLGNPGPKYKNNRHNVGFTVIDQLGGQFAAIFKRSLFLNAFLAQITIAGQSVILIKPRTFMNNSGTCVKKVLSRYGVPVAEFLVVHDDADLPLGALRFRKKGSSAGHNGMESIIKALTGEEINRLRVGIGKSSASDLTQHVLSDFSSGEQDMLKEAVRAAVSACIDWVSYTSDYVMSKYNQTGG